MLFFARAKAQGQAFSLRGLEAAWHYRKPGRRADYKLAARLALDNPALSY